MAGCIDTMVLAGVYDQLSLNTQAFQGQVELFGIDYRDVPVFFATQDRVGVTTRSTLLKGEIFS